MTVSPSHSDSPVQSVATGSTRLPVARCRGGRRTLLVVCGLLAMFVLGGVAGASLHAIWLKRQIAWIKSHQADFPDVAAGHMAFHLGLTDEQQQRLRDLIRRHDLQLHELRAEVGPRFDALFDQIERETSEILTPEQFKKWLAEFRTLRQYFICP